MKTIKTIKELFGELLALVLIIGIFILMAYAKIDESTRSTLKDILLAVVFYFFGSSAGSKRKQESIDSVIDKKE